MASPWSQLTDSAKKRKSHILKKIDSLFISANVVLATCVCHILVSLNTLLCVNVALTLTQQLGQRNSHIHGRGAVLLTLAEEWHHNLSCTYGGWWPPDGAFAAALCAPTTAVVRSPEVGSQALQTQCPHCFCSTSADLDIGEASPGEVISDLEVFTDSLTVWGGHASPDRSEASGCSPCCSNPCV